MEKIYIERVKVAPRARTQRGGPKIKLLPPDSALLSLTAAFVIGGLIFTYSSSGFDSLNYFKRQVVFNILGAGCMLFLSQFYSRLQKLIKPVWLLFITWGLLAWALLSAPAANVHRWINFGFFNLQPSEVAKLVLIIYLAGFLSKKKNIGADFKQIITPALYSLITIGLIVAGKDLGIPVLMFAVAVAVFFIAGAPLLKLLYAALAAVPVIAVEIYRHPYRLTRTLSFLSPEEAAGSVGYQLVHSFYAIGSGGWFGKGLGSSDLKLEYLPA
ncbi:MAG: FtsW/RodA/SpoVE family cell cycle protein, partial [Elusimicrobiota bacterium]|nr:FtsW/RodA/SpoVE family cell cycle protein [Elusimicrobiota bacterium]